MTIQSINLGNYANDGTGDDLRTAFTKVNANFAFLNTEVTIGNGTNLGGGTAIFADKNGTNLEFKTLTSTGSSIAITHSSTSVNLESVTVLNTDPAPTLGADLNLNGHRFYGGDTQTTVYGLSVQLMDSFIAAILETRAINLDIGSFISPTGADVSNKGFPFDFGTFLIPVANSFDFGTIV